MKRKKKIITILSIISLLFINGDIFASDPPTDSEISRAVENELLVNSTTPAFMIDIETDEGIVTLTGSVDNLIAKDMAVKIAETVKGVRGVVNRIEVDAPYKSDYSLKKDVEGALLADPATEFYEVDVTTDKGNVTLTGTVDSYQEKELSAFVAKSVEGVKSIYNEIDVDFETDRPDWEIRDEIEQTLKFDKRVDHALIDVSVNNGVVELSGTVGSANEKSSAGFLSWTAGVVDVNTEDLEVEEWARNDQLRKDKYITRSDSEIKDAVKDAFLYDPRIYSFNPEVTVDYGVVTLTGEVDNLKAKKAAEQDAKNIVGVNRVKNYLKVRPEFIPEDPLLETEIETSLLKDPVVEKWEIDVTADNGIVYLNGNVDNYFEKIRAEDIASGTRGVIAVENNIAVNDFNDYYDYRTYGWNTYYPIYQIDVQDIPSEDEEIEDDIKSQLWWSPYVNEDEINVKVEDGTATLTGLVDTDREKTYAEINAYEGGAVDVNNNLIVEFNAE